MKDMAQGRTEEFWKRGWGSDMNNQQGEGAVGGAEAFGGPPLVHWMVARCRCVYVTKFIGTV